MTTLVDKLVPDQLCRLVKPLLPLPPRPPYGDRHRTIGDRNCFAAIVFMARTSTPWLLLPAKELGCARRRPPGSGSTSGPGRAYSSSSTSRSWTGSASRAGWTGHERAWTRPVCAPNDARIDVKWRRRVALAHLGERYEDFPDDVALESNG
jgi:transposase